MVINLQIIYSRQKDGITRQVLFVLGMVSGRKLALVPWITTETKHIQAMVKFIIRIC